MFSIPPTLSSGPILFLLLSSVLGAAIPVAPPNGLDYAINARANEAEGLASRAPGVQLPITAGSVYHMNHWENPRVKVTVVAMSTINSMTSRVNIAVLTAKPEEDLKSTPARSDIFKRCSSRLLPEPKEMSFQFQTALPPNFTGSRPICILGEYWVDDLNWTLRGRKTVTCESKINPGQNLLVKLPAFPEKEFTALALTKPEHSRGPEDSVVFLVKLVLFLKKEDFHFEDPNNDPFLGNFLLFDASGSFDEKVTKEGTTFAVGKCNVAHLTTKTGRAQMLKEDEKNKFLDDMQNFELEGGTWVNVKRTSLIGCEFGDLPIATALTLGPSIMGTDGRRVVPLAVVAPAQPGKEPAGITAVVERKLPAEGPSLEKGSLGFVLAYAPWGHPKKIDTNQRYSQQDFCDLREELGYVLRARYQSAQPAPQELLDAIPAPANPEEQEENQETKKRKEREPSAGPSSDPKRQKKSTHETT